MKRASHIPAPRAAACDDLHLRASAQHWHVSTFCVIGNSPEFPVITSENTLREFPLVIATVAKVSRKRGLWLVVRVKKFPAGQTGVIISLVCLAGSISTCVRKCQDHFLHIFSRSDHSHLLQIGSDRYFISAKISRPG